MRTRVISAIAALFVVCSTVETPLAQKAPAPPPKKNPLLKLAEPWPEDDVLQARRIEADTRPLFKDTEPLAFTLTADFSAINKDRNPESTKRYPGVLTVADANGAPRDIPVKLSARGHFRLMARNCDVRAAARRVPAATTPPARRSRARRR